MVLDEWLWQLPDKAIDLIDESSSRLRLQHEVSILSLAAVRCLVAVNCVLFGRCGVSHDC